MYQQGRITPFGSEDPQGPNDWRKLFTFTLGVGVKAQKREASSSNTRGLFHFDKKAAIMPTTTLSFPRKRESTLLPVDPRVKPEDDNGHAGRDPPPSPAWQGGESERSEAEGVKEKASAEKYHRGL